MKNKKNKKQCGAHEYLVGNNIYKEEDFAYVTDEDFEVYKQEILKNEKKACRLGNIGAILKYGGSVYLILSTISAFAIPAIGIPNMVVGGLMFHKGSELLGDSKGEHFSVRYNKGILYQIEEAKKQEDDESMIEK